jgi:hypothetical protein
VGFFLGNKLLKILFIEIVIAFEDLKKMISKMEEL